MSEYTAISEASRSLQNLLQATITHSTDPQLRNTRIDLRSPKEMLNGGNNASEGISLWLYRVTRNAELTNRPPRRITVNQFALPALPLNLYYLVTPVFDDPLSKQILLGRVLQVFHDHAILRGNDLTQPLQLDTELRVTLESLTLDELSQVWQALQDPYQLSVTYLVQLVSLDADQEPTQSSPVLSKETTYTQILSVR